MGLFGKIFDAISEKQINKVVEESRKNYQKPAPKKYLEGEDELEMDWEEGSTKQQSWANRLVKEFLKDANRIIDENMQEGAITQEEANKLKYEINDAIELQDDANWWIDNRDENIRKKMIEITYAESKEDLLKIIKRVAY